MKWTAYDPRDPEQSPDHPETWKETDNPALIGTPGMIRMAAIAGRTIDWQGVAECADYCDQAVEIGTMKPPYLVLERRLNLFAEIISDNKKPAASDDATG